MNVSGKFDAEQQASQPVSVPPHNSVVVSLDSAALTGAIILERENKSGFEPVISFKATSYSGFEYVYENSTDFGQVIRLRCEAIDDGDGEEVDYVIAPVKGEKVEIILSEKSGKMLAQVDDLGRLVIARSLAHDMVPAHDVVLTNDSAPVVVSMSFYETKATTSGSEGNEGIELVDGSYIGQRKLVTLASKGHEDDAVDFDNGDDFISTTGAALASLTIDDEDGFVLLEWRGAWHVIALDGATETEV